MITHFVCEVLIVGAGLAGLAAGYDLVSKGYDVKIVEAENRVGGRVFTHHLVDGNHFEEGPFAFGNGEQPLWDYVHEFNLPFIKHPPMQRRFYFQGYEGTFNQKGFFLEGKEKEVVLNEFLDYFRPVLEEITDDIPFSQALELVGASAQAIEWLQNMTLVGLLAPNFQNLSTKAVLAFIEQYDTSTAFYTLQGGNDQLPQAFAKKLEGKILLNHRVDSVEQQEKVCLITGPSFSIKAQVVIFTVPLPRLGTISINPHVSLEKQEIIKNNCYTPCARLSMIAPPYILSAKPQAGVFLFSDQLGWIRDQSAFQRDTCKKTVFNTSLTGKKAEECAINMEKWKQDLSDFLSNAYEDWDNDHIEYHFNFLSEGYA